MDPSLSSWLALRERADTAARSAALTRLLVEHLPRHRPLRIVDLGTGTGANVRYLSEKFDGVQHWLIVDEDPELLREASDRLGAIPRIQIETRRMSLGTLDADLFARRDLVTASALLDLVSDTWLRSLAQHCRSAGAVALFALTYDGYSSCAPREPEDDEVRALMNRHQRQNDKGFGRAAGPDATDAAARAFAEAGFRVRRAPSDWVIAADDPELQGPLIQGWADAASEIAPERAGAIGAWLARRRDHVAAGRSRIVVGHEDLVATLDDTRD